MTAALHRGYPPTRAATATENSLAPQQQEPLPALLEWGVARVELFDLAVNRAASYADRLGAPQLPGELRQALELWYLKTRFAYRIPLDEVVEALLSRPGPDHHWRGGRSGGWHRGEPPRP